MNQVLDHDPDSYPNPNPDPPKQVLDHDPDGTFIKEWVPELRCVPVEYIAEPHRMPPQVQMAAECMIGRDYPEPIVDHTTAYSHARSRIATIKGRSSTKQEAAAVFAKHGSRKRPDHAQGESRAKKPREESAAVEST